MKVYVPERKKVHPFKPRSKRPKLIRPLRYPLTSKGLDIDLMKPEKLHGEFCACGRRLSGEASCMGCWNDELEDYE